jgi:error-prone DNA polymerase
LIGELGYESYTVHDIVRFARSRGFCARAGARRPTRRCVLPGITEIDPSLTNMLFERFLSKERNEPPDIDVDFEHDRREEVLQYVFQRYGRHRAALTAVVSSYHASGAVRDVAKAWACRRTRSTPWPTAAGAGATMRRRWSVCVKPASTRTARSCAAC